MGTIEMIIEARVFGEPDRSLSQPPGGSQPPTEYLSTLQMNRLIVEGMDGALLRRLSERIPRSILAETLGADTTNFSKLYRRTLSKIQTDEINDLTLLWEELRAFFEDDRNLMDEWLSSEVPALGGAQPRELLSTISGRKSVRQALDAMRYGDFS